MKQHKNTVDSMIDSYWYVQCIYFFLSSDVIGKVLQSPEGENGRKMVLIGSNDCESGLPLRLWGKHVSPLSHIYGIFNILQLNTDF